MKRYTYVEIADWLKGDCCRGDGTLRAKKHPLSVNHACAMRSRMYSSLTVKLGGRDPQSHMVE